MASSIFFYFSDDAGDNFTIEPRLHRRNAWGLTPLASDTSGTLTVWRKRWVDVYAMKDPNGDSFYPRGNLDTLKPLLVSAFSDASDNGNRNAYLDLVVQNAVGPDAKTLHTEHVAQFANDQAFADYVRAKTSFHHGNADQQHHDNRYQLIGVRQNVTRSWDVHRFGDQREDKNDSD